VRAEALLSPTRLREAISAQENPFVTRRRSFPGVLLQLAPAHVPVRTGMLITHSSGIEMNAYQRATILLTGTFLPLVLLFMDGMNYRAVGSCADLFLQTRGLYEHCNLGHGAGL
jgi:hypothetical protein